MDGVEALLGEIQDTMNMIGSFGKDEGVCCKDIKDSVNDKAKLAETRITPQFMHRQISQPTLS